MCGLHVSRRVPASRIRWRWARPSAAAAAGGIWILCGRLKSSCFKTQVYQRSLYGFTLALSQRAPCVSNRSRLKLSFWKSACLCLSLQMPFCVTLEEHCILPIEDVIMKTLIFPAHHCLVRFSEEGYKAKVASVSWLWQSPIASFIQIIALPYPLKVALIS